MGVQRWGVLIKSEEVIIVVTATGQRSMISAAQLPALTAWCSPCRKGRTGLPGSATGRK